VIFDISSYSCLFVSYLQCNLCSKASTSQIKPHIYFILDIAGCFHISRNLLPNYMSTIFVTIRTDIYSSVFSTSSAIPYNTAPLLQSTALHLIILHALRYFSFCHNSNFSYVKELGKRTQELRQNCAGQTALTAPFTMLSKNRYSIKYHSAKIRIYFRISIY
jgi:hypothetical protein